MKPLSAKLQHFFFPHFGKLICNFRANDIIAGPPGFGTVRSIAEDKTADRIGVADGICLCDHAAVGMLEYRHSLELQCLAESLCSAKTLFRRESGRIPRL
jgi:hypothetical protein